jgi:hypothetical protein
MSLGSDTRIYPCDQAKWRRTSPASVAAGRLTSWGVARGMSRDRHERPQSAGNQRTPALARIRKPRSWGSQRGAVSGGPQRRAQLTGPEVRVGGRGTGRDRDNKRGRARLTWIAVGVGAEEDAESSLVVDRLAGVVGLAGIEALGEHEAAGYRFDQVLWRCVDVAGDELEADHVRVAVLDAAAAAAAAPAAAAAATANAAPAVRPGVVRVRD